MSSQCPWRSLHNAGNCYHRNCSNSVVSYETVLAVQPRFVLTSGGSSCPKKYRYPDIEEFCVFPKNPEQIKPTFYEPSQWQIEIKVPSKILPNLAKRMPWLRRHIVAVHDERVVCLTSHVAFYLEQERWADLRSPADREKLAEYFTNGKSCAPPSGTSQSAKNNYNGEKPHVFREATKDVAFETHVAFRH